MCTLRKGSETLVSPVLYLLQLSVSPKHYPWWPFWLIGLRDYLLSMVWGLYPSHCLSLFWSISPILYSGMLSWCPSEVLKQCCPLSGLWVLCWSRLLLRLVLTAIFCFYTGSRKVVLFSQRLLMVPWEALFDNFSHAGAYSYLSIRIECHAAILSWLTDYNPISLPQQASVSACSDNCFCYFRYCFCLSLPE